MLKAYERCSLMGCSIEPDPNVVCPAFSHFLLILLPQHEARTDDGLVRGHAYSLTKVVKAKIETPRISGEIPLVRVRNPWGNEVSNELFHPINDN